MQFLRRAEAPLILPARRLPGSRHSCPAGRPKGEQGRTRPGGGALGAARAQGPGLCAHRGPAAAAADLDFSPRRRGRWRKAGPDGRPARDAALPAPHLPRAPLRSPGPASAPGVPANKGEPGLGRLGGLLPPRAPRGIAGPGDPRARTTVSPAPGGSLETDRAVTGRRRLEGSIIYDVALTNPVWGFTSVACFLSHLLLPSVLSEKMPPPSPPQD